MTRTIVTNRARWMEAPPTAGQFVSCGRAIYRVVQVATLRVAGDDRCRFRLALERVRRTELPDGAVIHAWPCAPHARRTPPRPSTAAVTPEAREAARERITTIRRDLARQQAARVARMGREVPGPDLGPAIRRRDVRDRTGQLLRPADVQVCDGADPHEPKRSVRRAVRADPLEALWRAGSITAREVEAAEQMRSYLEHMAPSIGPGMTGTGVQICAFDCAPITTAHLVAARKVRLATEALGERHWPPVLWVLSGGTVQGFAMHCRMRLANAGELVRSSFAMLADHLLGNRLAA